MEPLWSPLTAHQHSIRSQILPPFSPPPDSKSSQYRSCFEWAFLFLEQKHLWISSQNVAFAFFFFILPMLAISIPWWPSSLPSDTAPCPLCIRHFSTYCFQLSLCLQDLCLKTPPRNPGAPLIYSQSEAQVRTRPYCWLVKLGARVPCGTEPVGSEVLSRSSSQN